MKHIISIIILAIVCQSVANAQNCKVPISVQLYKLSTNTKNNQKDVLGESFMKYLDSHGFTTKVHNTRVAISLMLKESDELCPEGEHKMNAEIKFIDAVSGTEFYTTQLSKQYCGDIFDIREELAADLAGSLPELDSLAEAIRKSVIDAFEINTQHVAEIAQQYAVQGNHKIALFALVQYPGCCKSYPKIRNFMVAVFRDYMKKDHEALLDHAKSIWKNAKTDVEARFVVSLLKSDSLDDGEQMKADRILSQIAADYPSLNLNTKEDFTKVSELKVIALREAYNIGKDYSTSNELFPKVENFIPTTRYSSTRYEREDLWYRTYMDYYDMYYDNYYDSYYDNYYDSYYDSYYYDYDAY